MWHRGCGMHRRSIEEGMRDIGDIIGIGLGIGGWGTEGQREALVESFDWL